MVIAVDFDGTIVEHRYPKIGAEIPFAVETLKRLQQEHHHRLILWTVRIGKTLDEAIEFCKKRGLEFYAHNCNYPSEKLDENVSRKIVADVYIDDRNWGGLPDWGVIYRQIVNPNSQNSVYRENKNMKKNKNIFSFICQSKK